MILGIVGSEAKKFTEETADYAQGVIWDLCDQYAPSEIVSGECHLGGVDAWAESCALARGIPFLGFPPLEHKWATGYKPRNVQIAMASDVVVCITVRELPPDYEGMRFNWCYHCKTKDHVKSGGCWTVKYAKKIGKVGRIIVI